MRSRQLRAALTDFAEQAAVCLHADVLAGHEVPFELVSRSSRGRGSSPLYCYRPLTDAFIAERFGALRGLDAYAQAVELIEGFDGLDRYLLARDATPGPGRRRGDAALLALLQDIFDEQTDFDRSKLDQPHERSDRALERLDAAALGSAAEVTLVATLHGLTISSPELPLTGGLLLAHPGALEGMPAGAVRVGADLSQDDDHLLVVFTSEELDPRAALAGGGEVVRELLRALRLFGDGRVTLGSLAWTRIGAGSWTTVALGLPGRPHGMLVVTAEQEDELRAFCNLVSRRAPHSNEIAWAMRRFEMGCERENEYEAISDHLMGLRALLEPEGPSSGLLAGRLAALCATPDRRTALAERTLKAMALERDAIAGTAVERASGLALARDISNHLRALLRDVVCGHLSPDLVSLADELLLSGEELGEEMLGDGGEPAEVLHFAV